MPQNQVAAAAAGAAAGVATTNKIEIPKIKSKSEFPSWDWKIKSIISQVIKILPQFTTIVADETKTIADAAPPLDAQQQLQWQPIEASCVHTYDGDAATLVQGANAQGFIQQYRLLSKHFSNDSHQIDKSRIYQEVTSTQFELGKHPDFAIWFYDMYSKCLKIPDFIPPGPALNNHMCFLLRNKLDPTCMEDLMANFRNKTNLKWEDGVQEVEDFIKSGRAVQQKEVQSRINSVIGHVGGNNSGGPSSSSSGNGTSSGINNNNPICAPANNAQDPMAMLSMAMTTMMNAMAMNMSGGLGGGKNNNGKGGNQNQNPNTPFCNYCRRNGHAEAYCWDKKRGKQRAKGPGGGNNNGNNNKRPGGGHGGNNSRKGGGKGKGGGKHGARKGGKR